MVPGVAGLALGFAAKDTLANFIAAYARDGDIAAARARVEGAGERIKEAKAAFYPNVNLSALVGLSSFGLGNLFSSGAGFGSVTPAVSLPLFHGGALQGQYRGRRGQSSSGAPMSGCLRAQSAVCSCMRSM